MTTTPRFAGSSPADQGAAASRHENDLRSPEPFARESAETIARRLVELAHQNGHALRILLELADVRRTLSRASSALTTLTLNDSCDDLRDALNAELAKLDDVARRYVRRVTGALGDASWAAALGRQLRA